MGATPAMAPMAGLMQARGAAPTGVPGVPGINPVAAAALAAAPGSPRPPGLGFAKGGRVRKFNSTQAAAENLPTHPGAKKLAKGGVLRRKPPKVKQPVPTPPPEGPADNLPPPGPMGGPPAPGPTPMMAKGGKWIQDAKLKKGALHKELGVPQGEKIPEKKLEKAAKAPGKLGRRARTAETLKGLHHAEGGKICTKCGKAHGGACKMAKGGFSKFDSTKGAPGNLPTGKKKFAAGGAAKERKGFPNTLKPPRKGYAEGGKVRGAGAAERGTRFSGIY
jgi:hypothetical protein